MTTILKILVASSFLFACGDDADGPGSLDAALFDADTTTPDAANNAPDAQPGVLTLASTALTEGAEIPLLYTCANPNSVPTNISPPFTWTGGPAAASYAMVFRDVEPGAELIHSIIYDIPASEMALPEGVEKEAEPAVPAGSKQLRAYSPKFRGYLGPCPGNTHAYEFRLSALDVATLPGVTLNSSRSAVETAILENMIATDTLGIVHTPAP
jgi:phosphatidylethanolamine-binding protein (PEBP) family uncharacterized protein